MSSLLACALIALVGCKSEAAPAGEANAQKPSVSSSTPVIVGMDCVLGVQGARVSISDTPDGADIVFFAPGNQLDQLRRRAHDQASMYGPDAGKGLGHDGRHGWGQGHGLRLWDLPSSRAEVTDTPSGARIHVATGDPARVAEVQTALHARAAELGKAPCP